MSMLHETCKLKLIISVLVLVNINAECVSPKKYVVSSDKAGFHTAFITCRQYGYEPAEIHSLAEQKMVEELLKNEKLGLENGYWIFATNLDEKKAYYWLNSGRRLLYSNFSAGQPDNYNNMENCLHVFHTTPGRFAWNDIPCNSNIRFLCQHNQVCD
ncbi:salivary C-type lectin 2-like [Rhynchophorus ferrugineus]|uniref:C-type lectin domain-containing protein n=1 Tax=Rhynchophorus ferrugineus TaxID=354439 RepID=A0A834MD78_RHYFE|nr:hypothetical protein GWI33_013470 [Rhynchophorus ferrugineus]